jgi:hypothetical protein
MLYNVSKPTKQQEILHHLRNLAHLPDEQVRYSLEILDRERGKRYCQLGNRAEQYANIAS